MPRLFTYNTFRSFFLTLFLCACELEIFFYCFLIKKTKEGIAILQSNSYLVPYVGFQNYTYIIWPRDHMNICYVDVNSKLHEHKTCYIFGIVILVLIKSWTAKKIQNLELYEILSYKKILYIVTQVTLKRLQ